MERILTEVKRLIRGQEKTAVRRVKGLLEQLEQEIAELRKRSTELEQLSHTEDHIHFLQSDVLQLTLDLNTAHPELRLSDGNWKVTATDKAQPYPDYWRQVLCREGLSGVCYWEVEWSGGWVEIVVSYKGIIRKGKVPESTFLGNSQSWTLECYPP
ncbi:neoverrucotoxin subunit beta-like, partial [Coregonus clupeaformis]|uniref:neoverrucotoxin subunit beta-like n=1 Tax=Coregonus clupeaformis TaxID=59861 RepID=UPI001E1C3D8F